MTSLYRITVSTRTLSGAHRIPVDYRNADNRARSDEQLAEVLSCEPAGNVCRRRIRTADEPTYDDLF